MEMAAEVSFEEGLTKGRISGETVRATLSRMGVGWQRAKHWITSPDPLYDRKKASFASDQLMHLVEDKLDWVVGFEEECCWSRVRQPNLHSFGEAGEPLPLVEQSVEKGDPSEATKAICCYGLYMPELKQSLLRGLWMVVRWAR
jgi:hypothetical protein